MFQFLIQSCLDVHLLMVHLEPSDIAHWHYTDHWNGYLWGCKPWRRLHCMLHLYCIIIYRVYTFVPGFLPSTTGQGISIQEYSHPNLNGYVKP